MIDTETEASPETIKPVATEASTHDMAPQVSSTTQVTITHPFPLTSQSGLQVVTTTLDCLRPYLPTSLPLYRRLQFGRFFDTSCIISNLHRDDVRARTSPSQSHDGHDDLLRKPWVVAFVDRSCRPETEGWVFGTWEADGEGPLMEGTERAREAERLMRGVVEVTANLSVPESVHQSHLPRDEQRQDPVGLSRDDYGSHLADSKIILWGAVHERTAPILHRLGVVSSQHQKSSTIPYHTFVFDIAEMPTPLPLLEGLLWGELSPQHFSLVRSRTQIPRQERTMAVLNSLAIYPSKLTKDTNSPPIAWALVGLDGSLTSLHVEPEWRGRGLAKALTTKLFREMMDRFWEESVRTRWAHGYVAVGNEASAGMCRRLGGKPDWECYWLRVDLGKGIS